MGVVIPDRQVVDRDQPDPLLEDPGGAAAVEADEVMGELVEIPEPRVRRLQDQSLRSGRHPGARERLPVDRVTRIGDLDHLAAAEHRLERQCVDAGAVVEEVQGSVDVGARVHAHRQAADVGAVSGVDGQRPLHLHARVLAVDDHPGMDRYGDVVEGHGHETTLTPPTSATDAVIVTDALHPVLQS